MENFKRVIMHKLNDNNIHYYVTEYNKEQFDENLKIILKDYVCFNISPLNFLFTSGFNFSEYTLKKIKETNNYDNVFPKTYFLQNELYKITIVELLRKRNFVEKRVRIETIKGKPVYGLYGLYGSK